MTDEFTLRAEDLKIIESPYMPEGFIAMRGFGGMSVLNVGTGYIISIPDISIPFATAPYNPPESVGALGSMLGPLFWYK
jgi:hypothetical protein